MRKLVVAWCRTPQDSRKCGGIEHEPVQVAPPVVRLVITPLLGHTARTPGSHTFADRRLLCVVAPMYSLRIQEKLDAERNQNSSRQILWKNLNDKKKSGRMVRRIYNKTRCVS